MFFMAKLRMSTVLRISIVRHNVIYRVIALGLPVKDQAIVKWSIDRFKL